MKINARRLPGENGEYVTEVLVNDRILGTFLIDTGSSDIMVGPRIMKALESAKFKIIMSEFSDSINTAAGMFTANSFIMDNLSITNDEGISLSRKNIKTYINPFAQGIGFDGIIGRSFFNGEDNIQINIK